MLVWEPLRICTLSYITRATSLSHVQHGDQMFQPHPVSLV